MKSTLERELKVCEIVEREALATRLGRGRSPGVLAGALGRVPGQHRFRRPDKGRANVAPSGSVIAPGAMWPAGTEDRASG